MATSPIYSWPEPDNTDLVKNGALAIRTLGNAIDTTMATMTPKTIVDAKGDLIAASAADTPARLAVGNNGETLVADSSTSTGLRYQPIQTRNCVYNSSMQVWQRGTSFTSTGYVADRFYWNPNVTGRTLSRQTGTGQFQYVLRNQRDSGNTNTTGCTFGQSFEIADATPYAGKTVTISFYARAGANFSATSSTIQYYVVSGTSSTETNRVTTAYPAGGATALAANATLTTTLQRFQSTFTFGAGVTQFAIIIDNTWSGTAGAADFYELTGLQLEVGSVATDYVRQGGTIQGELAACQRYYYRTNVSGAGGAAYQAVAFSSTTTNAFILLNNPVAMRVVPTSIDFSALCFTDPGVADYAITGTTLQTARSTGFVTSIAATVASGLTATRFYYCATTSSSGYIGVSSEL